MEIFTFMFMDSDGARERIEIFALGSSQDLKTQIASFDAAEAECYKVEDKQKLLAVVEAGFGDFEDFNARVRGVFDDRIQKEGEGAAPATAKVAPAPPA